MRHGEREQPGLPGGERALIVFEAAGTEETTTRAGCLMGPTLFRTAPPTGSLECIGPGGIVVAADYQEYKILISAFMPFVKSAYRFFFSKGSRVASVRSSKTMANASGWPGKR